MYSTNSILLFTLAFTSQVVLELDGTVGILKHLTFAHIGRPTHISSAVPQCLGERRYGIQNSQT